MTDFEDDRPSRVPLVVAAASGVTLAAGLVVAVLVASRPAERPAPGPTGDPVSRRSTASRPTVSATPPWLEPPPADNPPRPTRPPLDPPVTVDPPVKPTVPPEPTSPTSPPHYPPLKAGRVVYGEYHSQTIQGFTVLVNRTVFDEAPDCPDRPLDCLQDEFERLSKLPPRIVKAMRTVKVFVEWDHTEAGHPNTLAVFYGGGGEGFLAQGLLPHKAGHITILSLKRLAALKSRTRKAIIILHEMAHAAHHYDLGDTNPFVRNAYDQAMTRGLYRSVPAGDGRTARAYAATNEFEYFAEITCAYLDWCDDFPHDRQQLREYDSVGYELMRKVWGDAPPPGRSGR